MVLKIKMGSLWSVSTLLSWLTASYAQCDYYQEVNVGNTYYVYSPSYPDFYAAGTNCRWYAVSPPGTTIGLSCPVVEIPESASCSGDRLSISPSGDLAMGDADHYCGMGSFDQRSTSNKMNILLQASRFSSGGRFLCSITSQYVEQPPTTQPPPLDCECGWKKKTKIVGGSETGVNEYPMMAGLIDATLKIVFCGSTIISPRHVLTAAHCLAKRTPDKVGVLVGDHDLSTGDDTPSAKLLKASMLIIHPQYDPETQFNDIGVVRVASDIVYSQQVGPACLPFRFRGQTFEGEPVTVLGWGTEEFGGPKSDVLKQTRLNIMSQEQCRAAYQQGSISQDQMCSFGVDTDACQADSGGPLLFQDPTTGRLHLVGVISYGIACATEKPGVNVRVAPYVDWIQQVTDESYCLK